MRRYGDALTRRFTVLISAAVMISTGAAAAVVAHTLPGRTVASPAASSPGQATQAPATTGAAGGQAALSAPAVVSGGS